MGVLITLDFARRQRRRSTVEAGSLAEILFFTGVRYERHETFREAPQRATRKVRARKPRRKSERLNASG
jgi:hypothetical protein